MEILNTAAHLAGGLISRNAQREANQLNYKMFQEGNAFNAQQAALNRDATSAYSVAMQQRKAGLNPASQGATPISAGGSAASSAGMPTMQPVDGFSFALNDLAKSNSEIELNRSLVDKYKSETNLNDIEKQFRADILKGQVDLNHCTIDGIQYDNAKLKPAQLRELQSRVNNLDASSASLAENIKVAQQQIVNMKEEEIAKKLDNYFNNASLQSRIRGVKLDNQYKEALKAQAYNLIKVGKSEIALNDANRSVVDLTYQNGKISYAIRQELKDDEKAALKESYKYTSKSNKLHTDNASLEYVLDRTEQIVGIVSGGIGSISSVVGAVNSFKSASGMQDMGRAAIQNAAVNSSRNELEWQKYDDYITGQGRRKRRKR